MLFLSFLASLSPLRLFKAHVYICWVSDPLFLPLRSNGLFYYLYNQFLVALIIGPFYPLGFHKWPSTIVFCFLVFSSIRKNELKENYFGYHKKYDLLWGSFYVNGPGPVLLYLSPLNGVLGSQDWPIIPMKLCHKLACAQVRRSQHLDKVVSATAYWLSQQTQQIMLYQNN